MHTALTLLQTEHNNTQNLNPSEYKHHEAQRVKSKKATCPCTQWTKHILNQRLLRVLYIINKITLSNCSYQKSRHTTEEIQELINISHNWIRAVSNTDKCKCYLLNFEDLDHFSSVFLSFNPFVGVTSLKRFTCIWVIQWHSRRNHLCQILCQSVKRFFIGSTPNSAITLTQISGVASYEALGHMQHPQQCH